MLLFKLEKKTAPSNFINLSLRMTRYHSNQLGRWNTKSIFHEGQGALLLTINGTRQLCRVFHHKKKGDYFEIAAATTCDKIVKIIYWDEAQLIKFIHVYNITQEPQSGGPMDNGKGCYLANDISELLQPWFIKKLNFSAERTCAGNLMVSF